MNINYEEFRMARNSFRINKSSINSIDLIEFLSKISEYSSIEWNRTINQNNTAVIDCNTIDQPNFNKNLDVLVSKLEELKDDDYSIFICSDQDSQIKRLRGIFIELEN